MAKNLILGLILARFDPTFGPQKRFLWLLPIIDLIHCYKLSHKVLLQVDCLAQIQCLKIISRGFYLD